MTAIHPNRQLWEKGDFTKIAEGMRKSGSELVSRLGITTDMRVLDLGCGDGTTAIPAAQLGASVLGVDIASNLVAAGNQRAAAEGLINIRFQEGDAADLKELPDQTFDLVVTVFGAMFSSNPSQVAKEMVRVTRRGGRIVMGNWIPGDPTLVAQILTIVNKYTPPPPAGFVSPMLWGVEANVVERFADAGINFDDISFRKREFMFELPGTPTHFLERFKRYYGPTMNAFEAAEKTGKAEELEQELKALFNRENRSADPNHTMIPANYLEVTVLVR